MGDNREKNMRNKVMKLFFMVAIVIATDCAHTVKGFMNKRCIWKQSFW